MIDTYVNSWYKSEISSDNTLVNEVRYHIRYGGSILFRRIRELDLATFILTELLPLFVVHLERIKRISATIDKDIFPSQMIEVKIMENFPDIHFALGSRENEVNYLRQVADHLVDNLVDENRVAGWSNDNDSPLSHLCFVARSWPSHICRHFLRELIVFCFLLPVLDLLVDPDTINRLIILLFDSKFVDPLSIEAENVVDFLNGLTCSTTNNTPNSLLQLRLSEILRDARYLQIFTMYLKDIRGPINDLRFISDATDIHEGILNVQKGENLLNEFQYEMWLLYSRYIHSGAEERITLPEMVADEFQKAVESRQLELLDSSIEIAYQIVYTRLQCDFVVPFCQSDCFFGYLCGSPPITVDELINEEKLNEEKRLILPSAEPAFSLSQFRMRLWKIVMPSTSEASIDLSFDRLSDIDAYDSLPNDKAEIATEAVGDKNSDYSQLLNFDMNFKSGCEIENEIVDGTSCASCKDVELAERQPDCCAPYEFSIFDAQRDINRWMITIPHIQPRRDNGRLSYVYTVCVERFDLNGNAFGSENCCFNNSLNKWSVTRRYNEFYVLESKLLEFHGDLIRSDPLPIRRPFSAKNRIFIEMQRPIFERFIQLLTRQSALKKSDLLYTFLTSDQELKDNIQLSDLNPWNMVRKVPSKFTRERGQNLKPFILSLMAKALAPQSEIADSAFESLLSRGEKSETSSFSSHCYEGVSKPRKFLLSTIFGDNCPTSVIDLTTSGQYVFWTRSFTDSLAFLLDHLFLVPHWFASLLLSSQVLFGSAIDNMISTFLKRVFTTAFLESNCIHLIRFIQDSLFSGDSVTSTNQEKALRAELAQRLILEYLQEEIPSNLLKAIGHKEFRRGVIAILSALQYPRLNKQLSYVFLDILVAKLFHITCN